MKAFEDAVKMNFHSANEYFKAAKQYKKDGLPLTAVEVLRNGTVRFPETLEMWHALGTRLLELGNSSHETEAVHAYGKAFHLDAKSEKVAVEYAALLDKRAVENPDLAGKAENVLLLHIHLSGLKLKPLQALGDHYLGRNEINLAMACYGRSMPLEDRALTAAKGKFAELEKIHGIGFQSNDWAEVARRLQTSRDNAAAAHGVLKGLDFNG